MVRMIVGFERKQNLAHQVFIELHLGIFSLRSGLRIVLVQIRVEVEQIRA